MKSAEIQSQTDVFWGEKETNEELKTQNNVFKSPICISCPV